MHFKVHLGLKAIKCCELHGIGEVGKCKPVTRCMRKTCVTALGDQYDHDVA